jgi:DNA-binding MarR family transcriptional regulator
MLDVDIAEIHGGGGEVAAVDDSVVEVENDLAVALSGARPTDLAAGALMTKQALNRTIRHLERSGYLRLEPLASDQRARVVRLTDRGKHVLSTIRELHAEIEAEWADRIGQRGLAALRNSMVDLAAEISNRPGPVDDRIHDTQRQPGARRRANSGYR